MNIFRRWFTRLCFFLGLLTVPMFSWGADIVLNAHHTEAITSVFHHEQASVYVSTSRDGTIRTWVPGSFKTRHAYQLTNGSIEQAIPHPTRPDIAVLIRRQDGSYELNSINVNDGSRNFAIQLDDTPIHIAYSPQGSFLAYSMPRWDSLSLHNAATGRRLNLLQSVGGIMSFFTFSRSEANIMTYQASTGEITYFDVNSGRQLSRSGSTANLSHVGMMGTRFMVGARAGQLLVIDVVNGRTVSSTPVTAPIQLLLTDADSATIGAVTMRGSSTILQEWAFSGSSLIPTRYTPAGLPSVIRRAQYHGQALITASADHTLHWHHRQEAVHRDFSASTLQPVTGIARSDGRLHLSTSQGIVTIESDIFERSLARSVGISRLDSTTSAPPRTGDNGLVQLGSDRILVYPATTSRNLSFFTWSPEDDIYHETAIRITDPVTATFTDQETLLLVTNQGSVLGIDPAELTQRFEFQNIDVQTALMLNDKLITGKSRTSGFETPLLSIDPATMETVPVDNPAVMVFAMAQDPQRNLLYTLSLQQSQGESETVLRVHPGNNIEQSRIIARHEGEDMAAGLFFDPGRRRVYTTLGSERLMYWNGTRMIQMQPNRQMPRTVQAHEDLVWAVNRNGSVSFWQAVNGVYLGSLAVLDNNNWVFISSEGGFLSSVDFNVDRGLSLPASPRAPGEMIERYRVPVPF
ncbi:WD40 repeat domain-containing protein [Spirochaeta africana]|nr:WD40 repeat domain-containing protein [Spirochaeta africana]